VTTNPPFARPATEGSYWPFVVKLLTLTRPPALPPFALYRWMNTSRPVAPAVASQATTKPPSERSATDGVKYSGEEVVTVNGPPALAPLAS